MVKGLYTAWTGMLDEQNRLDILTNNLANADTTGYKKEGTTIIHLLIHWQLRLRILLIMGSRGYWEISVCGCILAKYIPISARAALK